jgi:hypothetical protein
VAYGRGELLHPGGGGADHIALGFAAIDVPAIDQGVTRLAAALREQLPPHGRAGRTRPATPRATGTRGRARRIADGAR